MSKITIRKLIRKSMTTKFGDTTKLIIQAEDGQYFDSWAGQFNQNWAEGQTIEIPDSQIKSREYQGKIYKTLTPPPKADVSQPVVDMLKQIADRQIKHEEILNQILQVVGFNEAFAEEIPDEILDNPL